MGDRTEFWLKMHEFVHAYITSVLEIGTPKKKVNKVQLLSERQVLSYFICGPWFSQKTLKKI